MFISDFIKRVSQKDLFRAFNASILILLCSLVLLDLYIFVWVQRREADEEIASTHRAIKVANVQVAQVFESANGMLHSILSEIDGRDPNLIPQDELSSIWTRARVGSSSLLRLSIHDKNGASSVSLDPPLTDRQDYFLYQTEAGRRRLERAMMIDAEKDLFIGSPEFIEMSNQWGIPISRAILSPTGAVQGLIVAIVPVSLFADLYEGLRSDRADLFALWRNDATILTRTPPDSSVAGKRFANAPLWSHYPKAQSGQYIARTVTDGVDRLVIYRGLAPLPLVLVYAIEEQNLSWAALIRYWEILLITMVFLVVALASAWALRRYMQALSQSNDMLTAAVAEASVASAARAIFIANMNHELRTPLNAVIGFSQMLRTGIYGELGHPKYREYAEHIEESGNHLLALIVDMIDIAEIESGHRILTSEAVGLVSLVEMVANQCRFLANKAGVRLDVVIDEAILIGDPKSLRQVLINVLGNAIKYSPKGGAVTLRAGPSETEGMHRIEICDHGDGIAIAELHLVGQPYFRTTASLKSAVGGTGLGLAITYGLVRQMRGTVAISCPADGGTCVVICLPIEGPIASIGG